MEFTVSSLVTMGYTQEQAEKLFALHKATLDGNYIPKATFNTKLEEIKALNTSIAERDNQIKELGAFKGTAEQLQIKVSDLEKENATKKSEYEAQLSKLQIEGLISTALTGKVVDLEDVLPKLDLSKLSLKDGKLEGNLDTQIEELKKTKPHYFKETKPEPEGFMNGMSIFGIPPQQGSGADTGIMDAEKIAINLAKSGIGSDLVKKATEHYFKG